MGDIHISVGRDVRGNVSARSKSSSTSQTNWDPDVILRVLEQYQAALAEKGLLAGDSGASIEATLAQLQGELSGDEAPDKSKVRQLLNAVRDDSVGTAASLFAGIVMAQVPWVWTAS